MKHLTQLYFACLFWMSTGVLCAQQDSLNIMMPRINIQSNTFQEIEKCLVVEAGTGTLKEALEYNKLGKLFQSEQKTEMAIENYTRSLAIFESIPKAQDIRYYSKGKRSKPSKQSAFPLQETHRQLATLFIQTKNLPKAKEHYNRLENKTIEDQFLGLELVKLNADWVGLRSEIERLRTENLDETQILRLKNLEILAQTKQNTSLNWNGYQADDIEKESEEKAGFVAPNQLELNVEELQTLDYEIQNEVANTLSSQNKKDQELELRQVISENKAVPKKQRAEQKLEIADLLIEDNNTETAKKELKKSMQLAKTSGDVDLELESIRQLMELNLEQKNYKKASSYIPRYDELNVLKDSQNQNLIEKSLAEAEYAIQQKESLKQIETKGKLVKQERQLSAKESSLLRQQMTFRNTLIIALSVLILILALLLSWYHRQQKKLKAHNLRLKLNHLRSQMNPHFIFNSLNAVNHFISQNNEILANEYISEFALLMRNVLNQSDLQWISLKEELEFLERYCALEHLRFSSKFDYDFEIDPDLELEKFEIPPLMLQPFVENAVWHGLRYLDTKGVLKLKFFRADSGDLQVEISDNGIGRTASKALKTSNQKKHKSKGLQLSKQRIEAVNELYHNKIQFQVLDVEPQGTRVILNLKMNLN
ncbi:MAG: sensor histidine kinase [Flavobacteriales bacterium]